ncbi:MAG: PLP-dependent transferase, partial [Opitutales bacterium]
MTLASLRHFPLGEQVPSSEHAVCVSLPTMADVIGYEEKDPRVMAKVQTGYPRFVIHKYVARMAEELLAERGLVERFGFAVTSANAAEELGKFLGTDEFSVEQLEGFAFAHTPDSLEIQASAKSFLQHTGFSVSSRQAEDFLAKRDLLEVQAEEAQTGDAENRVRHELADAMGEEVSPEAILLANSGANAFYALFRTARDILATQGRTIWIQLGWLYVDTIKVLEKFMDGQDEVVAMHNVTDLSGLRKLFAERGGKIAAVVTETPTNPLFQTCDLDEIRDLCQAHGAMLVADPTMASPRNAKVAGHADVIVNSLTKYAANEGDV